MTERSSDINTFLKPVNPTHPATGKVIAREEMNG